MGGRFQHGLQRLVSGKRGCVRRPSPVGGTVEVGRLGSERTARDPGDRHAWQGRDRPSPPRSPGASQGPQDQLSGRSDSGWARCCCPCLPRPPARGQAAVSSELPQFPGTSQALASPFHDPASARRWGPVWPAPASGGAAGTQTCLSMQTPGQGSRGRREAVPLPVTLLPSPSLPLRAARPVLSEPLQ